jgi:hypothetical protein
MGSISTGTRVLRVHLRDEDREVGYAFRLRKPQLRLRSRDASPNGGQLWATPQGALAEIRLGRKG